MGNTETREASFGLASGKPHGNTAGNFGADRVIKVELDIQKERMGKLIGTNGQTIKGIQQQAGGVKLMTPTRDNAASDEYRFVAVTLQGRATEVFKAAKLIHDVATACLAVLVSPIPTNFVSSLLQSPSIQGLKETIHVDNVVLPRKQDKQPKVVLEGYLEDVEKAYYFICDEVVKADREAQKSREAHKLKEISARRMGGGAAERGTADGVSGGGGGKPKKGMRGEGREGGKATNTQQAQIQIGGAAGAE
jgi:hypothetical protein